MKKILIAVVIAGFLAMLAAPAVLAVEDVTWGELKCLHNPDACHPKGQG